MQSNQVHSEGVTVNNGPHPWWHRRGVVFISISFIILTIFAVTCSLVLKFVVLAPKESENNTTAEAPPSPTTTTEAPPSPTRTTMITTRPLGKL